MAKGIEIGEEKGLERSIEIGKAEMARNMKKEREPVDKIVKYTQLSIEEIEKL